MNDSRFLLNYKTKIINLRMPARGVDSRDATRRHAQVCNYENDCNNGSVSNETTALSRIMKDMKEERKSQVRLSKRCKVRFRKNSLWDKSQRNGKVICIEPKDYQKLG
jgi:hypothetical protein